MNERIADLGQMTHWAELGPLTQLMLDLRKQALGREFNPITEERLEECSKALNKIMQCREKGLWKWNLTVLFIHAQLAVTILLLWMNSLNVIAHPAIAELLR